MKKKMLRLLSLFLAIIFPIVTSAQIFNANIDYSKTPSFGIKAGTNLSNVYDAQGEEFEADAKMGLAAGVFLTLPITSHFGLQPELLLSQKGYKGAGSFLGSEYSFTRTTNFIDVPIYLTFRTGEFLSFLFGPQYSYLISQNYTFKSDIVDISRDEHFENENLLKNTMSLSGGFDVNMNKIVLGVRGGWDMLNNKGDGTSTTPRYKNTWYQATIGYRF
jgi:hypothetical protein